MTEQKTKQDRVYSWQTGMPTKPDVDALMKQWPDPKVGDFFSYEDVAGLIGSGWKTPRFKSVTYAWRSRWQEQGVILECLVGEGFYVASADQISARTYDEISGIGRKARRHRKRLASVMVETEIQRTVIDHQGRLMMAIEEHAKKQRMNVLPSTASKPMPTALPPGESMQSSVNG